MSPGLGANVVSGPGGPRTHPPRFGLDTPPAAVKMRGMAQVVLENVSKTFSGRGHPPVAALRHVSLTVEDGERVVVVGPSGSGKTTLLRLIAGLEEPGEGTIRIEGRPVNGMPSGDRNLAVVSQVPALFPHLTARENLALGLKLRRRARAEMEERTREVAALLDLTGCLDRLPEALSGGERQRVALGRAIACRPVAFLFDEPLSGLDTPLRGELRAEMLRLHQRLGTTMIYVTHDQAEAMALGQRIVVLNRGMVEQAADPLTLYQRPANRFVAGFIGSPPMNFLRGTLVRAPAGFRLETAAPGIARPLAVLPESGGGGASTSRCEWLAGREMVLGVRPEHLRCGSAATDCCAGCIAGVTVDLVEPLGAETLIHCQADAGRLLVRASADARAHAGQMLDLHFDLALAHYFDPATGASLGPGGGASA